MWMDVARRLIRSTSWLYSAGACNSSSACRTFTARQETCVVTPFGEKGTCPCASCPCAYSYAAPRGFFLFLAAIVKACHAALSVRVIISYWHTGFHCGDVLPVGVLSSAKPASGFAVPNDEHPTRNAPTAATVCTAGRDRLKCGYRCNGRPGRRVLHRTTVATSSIHSGIVACTCLHVCCTCSNGDGASAWCCSPDTLRVLAFVRLYQAALWVP